MFRVLAIGVLLLSFLASRDAVQVLFAQPHVCDEVATLQSATDDEGCAACDQAADADNDDDVLLGGATAAPGAELVTPSLPHHELRGAPAPEPAVRPPV